MQKYSEFFKTLHDEQAPTGYLGRGTHYSVFRAVVFHDPTGAPLTEGKFADFAVIWDEDHDTRVMEPVEEIYRRGLLSSFLMFGESKGVFTAILAASASGPFGSEGAQRASFLTAQIEDICQSLSDQWLFEVVWEGKDSIIKDEPERVRLYLKNLKMLWRLGVAVPWMTFGRSLLKKVDDLQLSIRASNTLKNENIVYIGDLVQMTDAEFLRVPNSGHKSLLEIKSELAGMGLNLGMEVPGWPPANIDDLAKRFALADSDRAAR